MATKQEFGVNVDFLGNALLNKGAEYVDANGVLTAPISVSPANNFNPVGLQSCSILIATKPAVGTITGITAPSPLAYKQLTLVNSSNSNLTLTNNDVGSSANNRFLMSANNIITSNQCVLLFYDVAQLRWRILSKN